MFEKKKTSAKITSIQSSEVIAVKIDKICMKIYVDTVYIMHEKNVKILKNKIFKYYIEYANITKNHLSK